MSYLKAEYSIYRSNCYLKIIRFADLIYDLEITIRSADEILDLENLIPSADGIFNLAILILSAGGIFDLNSSSIRLALLAYLRIH